MSFLFLLTYHQTSLLQPYSISSLLQFLFHLYLQFNHFIPVFQLIKPYPYIQHLFLENQNNQIQNQIESKEQKMSPKVKFLNQEDPKGMFIKVIGRIQYDYFSLQQSETAPIGQKPKQILAQCQQRVESRLDEMGGLIKNENHNWENKVFGQNIWELKYRDWRQQETYNQKTVEMVHQNELQTIAAKMISSKAKIVVLSLYMSKLLLMFSHVEFKKLKWLTLHFMIDNLEPLAWMDCPQLKVLDILNTKITNSKPLAKLYTNQIHSLILNSNKCPQLDVSRIRMRKRGVLRIMDVVTYNDIEEQWVSQTQDIGKMAKAEAGWKGLEDNEEIMQNLIRNKMTSKLYFKEGFVGSKVIDIESDSDNEITRTIRKKMFWLKGF